VSREHHIAKAMARAASRDAKRRRRMRVAGTSVFTLRRLLRSKKP